MTVAARRGACVAVSQRIPRIGRHDTWRLAAASFVKAP